MFIKLDKNDGIIKNNSVLELFFLDQGKKKYLAKYLLSKFLKDGRLNKKQPIVIATSGKMGLALAEMFYLGQNPVLCVMNAATDKYKRQIESLSCGQVYEIPSEGTQNMLCQRNFANALTEKVKGFLIDQYYLAEQEQCYGKLCEKILKITGDIDCYVENVATGGTFAGFYKEITKNDNNCKFIVANPANRSRSFYDSVFLLKGKKFEIINTCENNIDLSLLNKILKQKGLNKKITFSYDSIIAALMWLECNDNKKAFVFIGD